MKKGQLRLLQRVNNALFLYKEACEAMWENPTDTQAAEDAQKYDMNAFLLKEEYEAHYC